jgi:hypothetical protein
MPKTRQIGAIFRPVIAWTSRRSSVVPLTIATLDPDCRQGDDAPSKVPIRAAVASLISLPFAVLAVVVVSFLLSPF